MSPYQAMRGDPAKSLAPITVRITADVKPKPIVAEIQVGQNIKAVLFVMFGGTVTPKS